MNIIQDNKKTVFPHSDFNGLLLVDKPAGLHSAAVVGRVKRLLPPRIKVGHAGTLDPFATGLLILLVGKVTRCCEQVMGWSKRYETLVKLGAKTITDDPETPEVLPKHPIPNPSVQDINDALRKLTGLCQQRPPLYSAIKLSGRRACDRARRGETFELQSRQVRIDAIEMLHYEWPLLRLSIDCGRGTYIRSIARDLGDQLGTGGYVLALRRTRIGAFDVNQALTPDLLTGERIVQHLQQFEFESAAPFETRPQTGV